MRIFIITASILFALNSFACDGSGKDKEEDKDERVKVTLIHS
jgi:hypothetical protein